jgi:hypothetical protein
MPRRVPVALLLLAACPKSSTSPPEARVDGSYVVTRETPFYDSGCSQDRANDGKLRKGTKFTLIDARDGCWHVRTADEDDVYIRPDRVAPAQ